MEHFWNPSFDSYPESLPYHGNHNQPDYHLEPSLMWRNVQYSVSDGLIPFINKKKKSILQSSCGLINYHTLNGLMGPSGAGKTTLLNALSGKNRVGLSRDAEIYLNCPSSNNNKPVIYFIEQHVHENITDCLTVNEIFSYAYKFKNQSGEGDEHLAIDQIRRELMLEPEILGRRFSACSGGEQKRIAIGQELMCATRKPEILFVDEPTTGLDSAAAIEVMSCLKGLVGRYRMSVLASVHVPSEEVLQLFDKLYVLSKGGVCIYSGSPGAIKSILEQNTDLLLSDKSPPIETLLKVGCSNGSNSNLVSLSEYQNEEFHSVSSAISAHSTTLLTPSLRSKHFSLRDFLYQISRLFRVTFISSYRIQLFFIALFLFYFLLLSTMFHNQMANYSGCFPVHNFTMTSSSNCIEIIETDILLRENLTFLNYALIYAGVVCVISSAVFFGANVKVFRSEHRNRKSCRSTPSSNLPCFDIHRLVQSGRLLLVINFGDSTRTISAHDLHLFSRLLSHISVPSGFWSTTQLVPFRSLCILYATQLSLCTVCRSTHWGNPCE